MKIIVDSREKKLRKDNFLNYIHNKNNDDISETCILQYGDYLFMGNDKEVVFEYKTVGDFLNSVKNGSVFEEVINQTIAYNYSYIVIVGSVEEHCKEMWKLPVIRNKWDNFNKYVKQHFKIYQGAYKRLLTICPVICVYKEEESFNLMYDVSSKIINTNTNFVFGSKRRLKDNNQMISVLSNVLGEKTSALVVTELNITCLEDLLTITYDDLVSIHGIADKKANTILDFIRKN